MNTSNVKKPKKSIQTTLSSSKSPKKDPKKSPRKHPKNTLNDLDGREWLKFLKSWYVFDAVKSDLNEAANNFYHFLNLLDKSNCKKIAVAPIPNNGIGKTINDRLKRAIADD